MRREVGNSNDLHGAKGPGSTAFAERPRPEVIQPCPVCGKQATVEVVEVTRADGRYQQTIYRCPNAARLRPTSAGRPKPRPDQHPIYKAEARIEDVPKIDPELRARYDQGVTQGRLTRNMLAQRTGIAPHVLSTILSGVTAASEERLEAIAGAIETLAEGQAPASGPGAGLRSEARKAEATRPRRPYARRTAAPPQEPAPAESVAPTAWHLAEQIERLVGQLLPQDPGGLLLQAAVRRGGWAGE